jgi:two-component system LytT family sensor kinase
MELKKHNPMNPIRWREHELILVTVYCLVGIAGAWWTIFEHTGAELRDRWGWNFNEHHLYFNFFINHLLPETGLLIAFFLAYSWMNLYILPRLVQADAAEPGSFRIAFNLRARIEVSGSAGETLKRFLWGLLNAIVLTVLLGAAWGMADYYEHQYDYIGWDRTSTANRVLGIGWKNAAGLVLLYIAYGFVREWSIRRLLTDARRNAFGISVLNQITTYTLVWLVVGCVIFFFNVVDQQTAGFYFTFFGVIPSLVLAGITNLYWVFPLVGEGRFFRWMVLRRLLWTTLAWSLPAPFFFVPQAKEVPPVIMAVWMGQLLGITPLAWIIFQRRKDKILELRGLQQALGQSEADLQFLRSQINPHFLFNVLNTLYGTALQEEALRTAGGIQQLGDMMRFMLHDNHQDKIPMSKEVEYLTNYIALQRLRTETSPLIRIETAIDEVLPDAMIAPMLLIPFVENAFKHGISLREPSWVRIRLNGEGKKMLFEIRNSVHARQGADPEKSKSGIGLKNVLHRLNLLYPGKHAFFVNQDDKEFFVQLMIEP